MFKHKRAVLDEILAAIKENDNQRLEWFSSFGTDIRHIIMNVYAYRRGLDFGFTEISFDQYGWFTRPQFLEYEIIKFGETANYNAYSESG